MKQDIQIVMELVNVDVDQMQVFLKINHVRTMKKADVNAKN